MSQSEVADMSENSSVTLAGSSPDSSDHEAIYARLELFYLYVIKTYGINSLKEFLCCYCFQILN